MKLNPNDAPAGYVAKLSLGKRCDGCEFKYSGGCFTAACTMNARKDGLDVIFVKRPAKPKKDKDAEWLREWANGPSHMPMTTENCKMLRRIARKLEKMP